MNLLELKNYTTLVVFFSRKFCLLQKDFSSRTSSCHKRLIFISHLKYTIIHIHNIFPTWLYLITINDINKALFSVNETSQPVRQSPPQKKKISHSSVAEILLCSQIISYDSSRGGVSVVTEKGDSTTSFLLVQQAKPTDSGRYTCNPSNAQPKSITVHVLNGEWHLRNSNGLAYLARPPPPRPFLPVAYVFSS